MYCLALDMWQIRKHKLYIYDNDSGPGQLHSQSSPGIMGVVEGQRNGKIPSEW